MRNYAEFERAQLLIQSLRDELDAIQDLLISSKERETEWLSEQRGRFWGLQTAAQVYLYSLSPEDYDEDDIKKLAITVKLAPRSTELSE